MTAPAWHIVSEGIVQTDDLGPTGRGLVPVYEIPFVIDSGPAKGHSGTVRVAVASASPENVAQLVNKAAEGVHGFAGLAVDASGNVST